MRTRAACSCVARFIARKRPAPPSVDAAMDASSPTPSISASTSSRLRNSWVIACVSLDDERRQQRTAQLLVGRDGRQCFAYRGYQLVDELVLAFDAGELARLLGRQQQQDSVAQHRHVLLHRVGQLVVADLV